MLKNVIKQLTPTDFMIFMFNKRKKLKNRFWTTWG